MTIFVQDIESIRKLDKLFEIFAGISGLKMNKDKTFIMLLGPHREKDLVLPFGKIEQMIKILGIYFSLDRESQERIIIKKY